MPLPFAFSVQRQHSEGLPNEASEVQRLDGMMHHAPANISTEPLTGMVDKAFQSPVQLPRVYEAKATLQSPPPAPSPNMRLAAETLEMPPFSRAPSTSLPPPVEDITSQLEQLRNDVFGIAMSVSALNDRLDRLEQRPSQGTHLQNAVATMQGQIENWLESHLNGAVEHCLHRIMAASSPPATNS